MTILKQTTLYGLHIERGAKMTAFAGYVMPVHYLKGIIQEHLHCRAEVGFFDISHMGQCRILGRNATLELEKLTPGGIVDLAVGQQKYTVLTNSDGGIIDDVIVTRIEDGLSMVVNAGCKEKDFAYLRQRVSKDCRFEELADLALLALQGPQAGPIMQIWSAEAAELAFMQACSTQIDGVDCVVSRSGYTGEDGFEISLRQSQAEYIARLLLAEAGVEPIGLGARDTLRLEAGLCLYGHELNETITPAEAKLQWIFKKGHDDFPGAETILRQLAQGPRRVRAGLSVDGKIPVREGAAVFDDKHNQVGYVTSGSFSPSLGRPIAMALIQPQSAKTGTRLLASVRDKQIAVTVCRLPFVPHRYHR
ncbi:glycine cleavage system aminomethyltransferase GcvT [Methylomonas sp. MgM2]